MTPLFFSSSRFFYSWFCLHKSFDTEKKNSPVNIKSQKMKRKKKRTLNKQKGHKAKTHRRTHVLWAATEFCVFLCPLSSCDSTIKLLNGCLLSYLPFLIGFLSLLCRCSLYCCSMFDVHNRSRNEPAIIGKCDLPDVYLILNFIDIVWCLLRYFLTFLNAFLISCDKNTTHTHTQKENLFCGAKRSSRRQLCPFDEL